MESWRPPSIGEVAWYFLRLGTTGFGGPAALAARMQRELVDERKWIGEHDYLDGLAFAQLAPGPLAAQLAMYLGFTRGGPAGCTAAGIAFVLPSFLMVLAIAAAYRAYGGLPVVRGLFDGIGPAAIGIMAVAAARLAAKTIGRDRLLAVLFAVSTVWTMLSEREIVLLFVAAGALTVAFRANRARAAAQFSVAVAVVPHVATTGVFLFFAKAGLFVFGSGLAIVPFLYGGVVAERHWLTDAQFVDAIAVAMVTPGPVVITVVFIGYLAAGLGGAAAAAAGIFAPVYAVVLALAPAFRRWSTNPTLRAFVAGVTAAAAGGIAGATFVLAGRSIHDPAGVAVASASLALAIRRWPEPAIVALAGAAGLLVHRA
jgi:chromate transporter